MDTGARSADRQTPTSWTPVGFHGTDFSVKARRVSFLLLHKFVRLQISDSRIEKTAETGQPWHQGCLPCQTTLGGSYSKRLPSLTRLLLYRETLMCHRGACAGRTSPRAQNCRSLTPLMMLLGYVLDSSCWMTCMVHDNICSPYLYPISVIFCIIRCDLGHCI